LRACRVAWFVVVALLAIAGISSQARASPGGANPATDPGATLAFTATAYCHAGTTRSGVNTHIGIAAADPDELPVGSVVLIETKRGAHDGIYTVLDTGSKVIGDTVDLFMRSCVNARKFGRQTVRLTILRKGWDPKAIAPSEVLSAVAGGRDW
jgi:3D (Asp-Asp-Asp) domain-containing protein